MTLNQITEWMQKNINKNFRFITQMDNSIHIKYYRLKDIDVNNNQISLVCDCHFANNDIVEDMVYQFYLSSDMHLDDVMTFFYEEN